MKTILIVEDDREIQEIYQERLTEEKYSVEQAFTVQEGLDSVKKSVPDLIVLDIMLPGGKNGFDFLEELKREEKWKSIPVIVLTNLDTEEKVARNIGVADYFVKANTSMEQVVDSIKKHLI